MLLKSVRLWNIRSYTEEQIKFPAGSILLSGDIGSGKSTILLAIEFALFGVKRTILPGSSLLRHGKKEGSVELEFEIEGKDIVIKRFLKRAKEEIVQDAGFIIVNGRKKDATAVELRSIVLELLGYPKELLTKSRDLLYRYTVYTPQEEMKQILFEEKEIRLDTLRKVFNIDKYKRVNENAEILARRLREMVRAFTIALSDLPQKQKQLKEKQEIAKDIEPKIKELKSRLEESRDRIKEKKSMLKSLEDDIKKLNTLKKDLEVREVDLKHKLNHRARNKSDIETLERQIKAFEDEISKKDKTAAEEIHKNIVQKEKEISFMENTAREISSRLSGIKLMLNQSKEIKNKIIDLDKCPTCEQNVAKEYKEDIKNRENKKITAFEHDYVLYSGRGIEAEAKLKQLKLECDSIRKIERDAAITKIKSEAASEKRKMVGEINSAQEKLKKEIGDINKAKLDLRQKIDSLLGSEECYKKSKSEFEQLLLNEKKLEVEATSAEKEREVLARYVLEIEKEVNEKIKIKGKLERVKEIDRWLEEFFMNLVRTIERHVMLNVHQKFNALFESWFGMMIEDDALSAGLDSDFSPIIIQDGYETTIENLSGGERTSVALSYRLALNKVINDIVSGIKTKDIIMLDEPTDGFSTEQLDRVREVLDRLGISQTILVSHESKIESFVNNVIRIAKTEHVSRVV